MAKIALDSYNVMYGEQGRIWKKLPIYSVVASDATKDAHMVWLCHQVQLSAVLYWLST